MGTILDHPFETLVILLVTQGLAAFLGEFLRRRVRAGSGALGDDLATILPAALTLLGLVIGFSFAMAVSRYDLRKSYEEAEANAIGTEYVRADLLSTDAAAHVRSLLGDYLKQRILFYEIRDPGQLDKINAATTVLQNQLWSAVASPANANPTPVAALVVSGMNDVLNSQGYTQAAWWNRIPDGAWLLMGLISIACNFLLGYTERHVWQGALLILPVIATIALFLIADIDSPRYGLIRVAPQNLLALSQSLGGR